MSDFIYLLNAMENAGHARNPHQHGYIEKRQAVLDYVTALEDEIEGFRRGSEQSALSGIRMRDEIDQLRKELNKAKRSIAADEALYVAMCDAAAKKIAECDRLTRELEGARRAKHHAVRQAEMQAQEARTQRAIVMDIGEIVGCANDWEMAKAVRERIAALESQLAAAQPAEVKL
jgi:hypothetical protein